jgi:hypothetical protein
MVAAQKKIKNASRSGYGATDHSGESRILDNVLHTLSIPDHTGDLFISTFHPDIRIA